MKKAMNAKLTTFLRKLQTGGLLALMICGAAFGARGQADAPVVKLWDKTYGGGDWESLHEIVPAQDSGFLLGGSSRSDAGFDKSEDRRGDYDYWIARVDAQGNKLWDKTYGGDTSEGLSSIVATEDGGFLLGGTSLSNAGFEKFEDARGGRDFWIVRIDAQGNKLWDKTYGGEHWDRMRSIIPIADDGFLLCGSSMSIAGFEKSEDSRGYRDYWIVRVDAQGNKLWDKTYGGNENDYFSSLVAAAGGDFLLGGGSESPAGFDKSEDSRGPYDFWLVKIADTTLQTSRAVLNVSGMSVAPHPNPFSGKTTFAINLEKPADLTLELRDVTGRLVASETFAAPQGQSEHTFDAANLSAGAYFYTLRAADGRKAEGKLIVK